MEDIEEDFNTLKVEELQNRCKYILSIYTDIEEAPQSIKNEYFGANSLITYLKSGIATDIGRRVTMGDGIVINKQQKEDYFAALEGYDNAYEINSNIENINKKEHESPKQEVEQKVEPKLKWYQFIKRVKAWNTRRDQMALNESKEENRIGDVNIPKEDLGESLNSSVKSPDEILESRQNSDNKQDRVRDDNDIQI